MKPVRKEKDLLIEKLKTKTIPGSFSNKNLRNKPLREEKVLFSIEKTVIMTIVILLNLVNLLIYGFNIFKQEESMEQLQPKNRILDLKTHNSENEVLGRYNNDSYIEAHNNFINFIHYFNSNETFSDDNNKFEIVKPFFFSTTKNQDISFIFNNTFHVYNENQNRSKYYFALEINKNNNNNKKNNNNKFLKNASFGPPNYNKKNYNKNNKNNKNFISLNNKKTKQIKLLQSNESTNNSTQINSSNIKNNNTNENQTCINASLFIKYDIKVFLLGLFALAITLLLAAFIFLDFQKNSKYSLKFPMLVQLGNILLLTNKSIQFAIFQKIFQMNNLKPFDYMVIPYIHAFLICFFVIKITSNVAVNTLSMIFASFLSYQFSLGFDFNLQKYGVIQFLIIIPYSFLIYFIHKHKKKENLAKNFLLTSNCILNDFKENLCVGVFEICKDAAAQQLFNFNFNKKFLEGIKFLVKEYNLSYPQLSDLAFLKILFCELDFNVSYSNLNLNANTIVNLNLNLKNDKVENKIINLVLKISRRIENLFKEYAELSDKDADLKQKVSALYNHSSINELNLINDNINNKNCIKDNNINNNEDYINDIKCLPENLKKELFEIFEILFASVPEGSDKFIKFAGKNFIGKSFEFYIRKNKHAEIIEFVLLENIDECNKDSTEFLESENKINEFVENLNKHNITEKNLKPNLNKKVNKNYFFKSKTNTKNNNLDIVNSNNNNEISENSNMINSPNTNNNNISNNSNTINFISKDNKNLKTFGTCINKNIKFKNLNLHFKNISVNNTINNNNNHNNNSSLKNLINERNGDEIHLKLKHSNTNSGLTGVRDKSSEKDPSLNINIKKTKTKNKNLLSFNNSNRQISNRTNENKYLIGEREKKLEEEKNVLETCLSEFIKGILNKFCHEFRNPLINIIQLVNGLKKAVEKTEKKNFADLMHIKYLTKSLSFLISDFEILNYLDFRKIDLRLLSKNKRVFGESFILNDKQLENFRKVNSLCEKEISRIYDFDEEDDEEKEEEENYENTFINTNSNNLNNNFIKEENNLNNNDNKNNTNNIDNNNNKNELPIAKVSPKKTYKHMNNTLILRRLGVSDLLNETSEMLKLKTNKSSYGNKSNESPYKTENKNHSNIVKSNLNNKLNNKNNNEENNLNNKNNNNKNINNEENNYNNNESKNKNSQAAAGNESIRILNKKQNPQKQNSVKKTQAPMRNSCKETQIFPALNTNESPKLSIEAIKKIIVSCFKIFQTKIDLTEKAIELKYFIANELTNEISIKSEPNRFCQLLICLLSNSLKFTNQGKIVLEINKDEKFLVISVKDSGVGIAPNVNVSGEVPLISHSHDSLTNIKLGFFILKSILKKMNGIYRVTQRNNRGTVAEVFIPFFEHSSSRKKNNKSNKEVKRFSKNKIYENNNNNYKDYNNNDKEDNEDSAADYIVENYEKGKKGKITSLKPISTLLMKAKFKPKGLENADEAEFDLTDVEFSNAIRNGEFPRRSFVIRKKDLKAETREYETEVEEFKKKDIKIAKIICSVRKLLWKFSEINIKKSHIQRTFSHKNLIVKLNLKQIKLDEKKFLLQLEKKNNSIYTNSINNYSNINNSIEFNSNCNRNYNRDHNNNNDDNNNFKNSIYLNSKDSIRIELKKFQDFSRRKYELKENKGSSENLRSKDSSIDCYEHSTILQPTLSFEIDYDVLPKNFSNLREEKDYETDGIGEAEDSPALEPTCLRNRVMVSKSNKCLSFKYLSDKANNTNNANKAKYANNVATGSNSYGNNNLSISNVYNYRNNYSIPNFNFVKTFSSGNCRFNNNNNNGNSNNNNNKNYVKSLFKINTQNSSNLNSKTMNFNNSNNNKINNNNIYSINKSSSFTQNINQLNSNSQNEINYNQNNSNNSMNNNNISNNNSYSNIEKSTYCELNQNQYSIYLNSLEVQNQIQNEKNKIKNNSNDKNFDIITENVLESEHVQDIFLSARTIQINNFQPEIIKIMVVDDEKLIRKSSMNVLNNYFKVCEKSIKIEECSDGIECLYKLYQSLKTGEKYEFVFIDQTMNFLNGSTTAKIIKDLVKDNVLYPIDITLVTSYEISSLSREFLSVFNRVFSKPLNRNILKNIFERD